MFHNQPPPPGFYPPQNLPLPGDNKKSSQKLFRPWEDQEDLQDSIPADLSNLKICWILQKFIKVSYFSEIWDGCQQICSGHPECEARKIRGSTYKSIAKSRDFAMYRVARENLHTSYLTENFEAIWGHNGLKSLTLVYSHSNIILQWYFWLEAVLRSWGHRLEHVWLEGPRAASSQKYHCNMMFEWE